MPVNGYLLTLKLVAILIMLPTPGIGVYRTTQANGRFNLTQSLSAAALSVGICRL